MQQTRKGWTLALSALGLFMVALDTLVVTTALPVLRVDLGASLSDLEWCGCRKLDFTLLRRRSCRLWADR
jgi:hypothetical protein